MTPLTYVYAHVHKSILLHSVRIFRLLKLGPHPHALFFSAFKLGYQQTDAGIIIRMFPKGF